MAEKIITNEFVYFTGSEEKNRDFSGEENSFSEIKKSLRRLINQEDVNGNLYYYDCIEVLSVQDYLNKLKLTDKAT